MPEPFDPDTATAQECREEAEEVADAIAGLERVVRRGHKTLGYADTTIPILRGLRDHLLQLARMKELPPEEMMRA